MDSESGRRTKHTHTHSLPCDLYSHTCLAIERRWASRASTRLARQEKEQEKQQEKEKEVEVHVGREREREVSRIMLRSLT